MKDRSYILRFFIILFVAIGCSSGAAQEESNNTPEFVDRTPVSTADQIPTSTPVEDASEEPEEVKLERPSEPELEPEEEQEEELRPEEEPEEEEEEEQQEQQEEDEEEEEIKYACFSYLDCPNHEACNIVSSTCYSCTEGWQCNNRYDLERSRPSFCCTPETFDEERCDMIGTCKG